MEKKGILCNLMKRERKEIKQNDSYHSFQEGYRFEIN